MKLMHFTKRRKTDMEDCRGYVIIDGERYETINGMPCQEDPSDVHFLEDGEELTEDKLPF